MFTAQAIALDIEKAGREDEIDGICRAIYRVAPEWPKPASEPSG